MQWKQGFWLRENFLHHVAMDVGQTKMTALKTVGQAFMVNAQKVYDGGLEIMMEYQKSKATKAEWDALTDHPKK